MCQHINRLFSFLRIVLRQSEFNTLMDLINFIVPRAYNTTIKVTTAIQPQLYNWKDWMQPYMTKLQEHSGPHVFHFSRNPTNNNVCTFIISENSQTILLYYSRLL